MDIVEEYIKTSRIKIPFTLVKAELTLFDKSKYPFKHDIAPLMCETIGKELKYSRAYISGARSLVMKFRSSWFKAKGIGTYDLAPVRYHGNRILTYFISRDVIGSGALIWGFLSKKEVKREVKVMLELKEEKFPIPEIIGMGKYEKAVALDFLNRLEMINYLIGLKPKDILKLYNRGREVEAYCIFCLEQSDIRVNEILQDIVYRYSRLEEADKNVKDYVRWLASSCAYNLRLHHDYGLLHGTKKMEKGYLTNSHVANHLVGGEKTWMTDYHLARRVESEEEKIAEVNCLLFVFNPLSNYYYTEKPRALRQLATEFMKGVTAGYRKDLFDVEKKLKKNILRKVVESRKMWKAQTYYSK